MTITDGLLSGGKRTVFAFGLFCLYTLSAAEETVVPSRYDEEMGVWIGDVVALTNAIKNVAASGTITLKKGIYDVSFLADAPMYGKPDKDYGAALLSSGGKQKVVIRGATGNPDDVILDGKGVFRVISLNGEVSQLRDLTVRNGRVDSNVAPYNYRTGGGVLFASSSTSVSNCIISGCYASRGGGGAAGPYDTKRGAVYDSRFYGNSSGSSGGAIRCCTLVSGCTVVSNSSNAANSGYGGGGIASCTVVSNTVVACNYAAGVGGGLYNCTSIFGSTLERNVADRTESNPERNSGGAYGGRFYGCTFRDNCAASVVKAVYMADCTVEDGRVHCLTNINCVFRNFNNDQTRVWAKGNVKYPDGKTALSESAFYSVNVMRGCVISNCVWYYNSGIVNSALIKELNGVIENCTFTDNAYSFFGKNFGVSRIVNCAIVGNRSDEDMTTARDLRMYESSTYCFSNCVWNVKGSDLLCSRTEPYVDGGCIVLGRGTGAKFTGKGDHPLTPKLISPLVGAGLVCDWMAGAVDLAGNPRLRDGKVDIGAYQCWLDLAGLFLRIR
jgi:hypothetical protein